MEFADQLQILKVAAGNPALMALATVDLAHHQLPQTERERIKIALLAAALPHWYDGAFLTALLVVAPEEMDRLMSELRVLTLIEPSSARGDHAWKVREDARLALREYLRESDAALWTAFSVRARAYALQIREPLGRVEAIYHHFAVGQLNAAVECDALDRELTANGDADLRRALAGALKELYAAGWLEGRARLEAARLDSAFPALHWPGGDRDENIGDGVSRMDDRLNSRNVFISYCHESLEHRRAVRAMGERLLAEGLPVELDALFLAAQPGGPDEGWAKWSEDRATKSEAVLVVPSPGWFAAYHQKGASVASYGAAAEARVFRQELYTKMEVTPRVRFVELTTSGTCDCPLSLSGWHKFRAADSVDFAAMVAWIRQRLAILGDGEQTERVVFLAETLLDDSGLRAGLAEELAARGWKVLPEQTYLHGESTAHFRRDLSRAVAFIQLLQPLRWEGTDRDFVQYAEAVKVGVKCLRYRDPDLDLNSVSDMRQRTFLGADPLIRVTQFDQFKKEVFQNLNAIWEKLRVPPLSPSLPGRKTSRLIRVVMRAGDLQRRWSAVRGWLDMSGDLLYERLDDFEPDKEMLTTRHRERGCHGFLVVCDSATVEDPALSLDGPLRECMEIHLDIKDDAKRPPVGVLYWPPPPALWPSLLKSRPLKLHRMEGTGECECPASVAHFFDAVRQVPL